MLPTADAIVIALYFAVVVGQGFWFVKSSSTTGGFMIGGGAVPGWAVGMSILGTYLSSNTFLAVPGKAYATNWNAFAFSLSIPIAAWFASRYFVRLHRECGSISAYDHLEHRFGPWARTYGAVLYLLTQVARVGAIYVGVSIVVSELTGWPQFWVIVVSGTLVTLYTTTGGIEVVIWTDVVQSIVLTGGAVALIVLLLVGMPEGPGQAVRVASQAGKFSMGSFALDFTTSTFWVPLLYGVVENLRNFGVDQSYVQRYHAAPSEGQAKGALWLGVWVYVPLSAVFFAIGSSAYAYYQTHPEMLAEVRQQVAEERSAGGESPTASPVSAESLTDADIGDRVLPHFIVHKLPAGMTGLVVAAIFAAAMSSIDTSLNSSATVLLLDVYRRRLRPSAGERESMAVLYGGTVLMGVAGIAVGLAMVGVESILDTYWTLSGVFAAGLLGLFLLGVVCRRADGPAAAVAVVVGLLVISWMAVPDWIGVPESLRSPLHEHMTIVVGALAIVAVGALASLFRPRAAP